MIVFDQLGRKVEIKEQPQRIISLVPSQTELLYDLGLREKVVGITKFCVHPPEWFKTKTRVGGTKKLNIEKIRTLKPDLIIANKEENEQSQVEELMREYPVWLSDIKTYSDAKKMIISVGEIAGKHFEATRLIKQIDKKFDELASPPPKGVIKESLVPPLEGRGAVIYFIWHEPMMVAGNDTFINEMLKKSGFSNAITDSRYPEINLATINKLKPDYLFLSSEPFPFKEKHVEQYQTRFPFSKPILVDGQMFSWYGSRMLKATDYFKHLKNG